jgi:hypothetical protein
MIRIERFALVTMVLGAMAMAQSNPIPLVNQPLVPDAAKPGTSALPLTVHGSGFIPHSVVKWNGRIRKTHFVSSTILKARIPASDLAKAGTASVIVSNPAPGGGVSEVVYFQIVKPTKSVSFNSSTFATGQEPYALVSGDFNGDGKLDLAVANVTAQTVSILLGKGDGTFQTQNTYAAGYAPIALAVGDFNGDGKLDLAVANGGNQSNKQPGTVTILLGDGKGAFNAGKPFQCGDGPFVIVAGDFNGDGNLDVAVADYNVSFGTSVAVLLGNGDGTLQPYASYTTGSAPIGLASEDLNNDGILDLVTANEVGGSVSVLLGNGDGTFQTHVDYAAGKAPLAVAVADLNQDNKPDIAVVNLSDSTVSVLLGKGDGTLQPQVVYDTGYEPVSIAVADINADNRQDLAIVNQGASTVSVLLGKGDGTFKTHVDFAAGSSPQGLAVGDFNRDGRLDLSVVDVFSNVAAVLLQGHAGNDHLMHSTLLHPRRAPQRKPMFLGAR